MHNIPDSISRYDNSEQSPNALAHRRDAASRHSFESDTDQSNGVSSSYVVKTMPIHQLHTPAHLEPSPSLSPPTGISAAKVPSSDLQLRNEYTMQHPAPAALSFGLAARSGRQLLGAVTQESRSVMQGKEPLPVPSRDLMMPLDRGTPTLQSLGHNSASVLRLQTNISNPPRLPPHLSWSSQSTESTSSMCPPTSDDSSGQTSLPPLSSLGLQPRQLVPTDGEESTVRLRFHENKGGSYAPPMQLPGPTSLERNTPPKLDQLSHLQRENSEGFQLDPLTPSDTESLSSLGAAVHVVH